MRTEPVGGPLAPILLSHWAWGMQGSSLHRDATKASKVTKESSYRDRVQPSAAAMHRRIMKALARRVGGDVTSAAGATAAPNEVLARHGGELDGNRAR